MLHTKFQLNTTGKSGKKSKKDFQDAHYGNNIWYKIGRICST